MQGLSMLIAYGHLKTLGSPRVAFSQCARVMPRTFIRDASVVGLTPRSAAAPPCP
jgi:hypothetical protein